MGTARVYRGAQAEARLQQLGIPSSAQLVTAARDGASAARATGPDHPRYYPGVRMQSETTSSLRIGLRPHGWQREVETGVDLAVERNRAVALVVTACDSTAADDRYSPQVRYERGEVIQLLVNGRPATLFGPAEPPKRELWMLLHYLSPAVLRLELSRPTGVSENGLITAWHERIMLAETAFADPDRRLTGEAAPVQVDVQRRVN